MFENGATRQDSYTLANARLGFRSSGGTFETALWIKNLTDEAYNTSMIDLTPNFGYVYRLLGAPRTYGIEATWRF